MSDRIHPTAIVHPDTSVGADVVIGPYAVIGPDVEIGDGTEVASHAVIERHTRLGRSCYVGAGAILGSAPQSLKDRGTATRVEIGDGTTIREHATVNRATAATGVTRIGRRCFIMTYAHVAHDCEIGDDVVIANAVQLAGHVSIESLAQLGGSTAIHQFVRVGTLAFVGGGSRVTQDIPPFSRAAGNPVKLYGINRVGLDRAGFDPLVTVALKRAYRLLFNSRQTRAQAVESIQAELGDTAEVARLLEFVSRSDRGVLRTVPA